MLPSAPGGKEIIAESMLWLLMTGKVPSEAQIRQLSRELAEKGELPPFVEKLVDSFVSLNSCLIQPDVIFCLDSLLHYIL